MRASCESRLASEQLRYSLRQEQDSEPVRHAEGPLHSTRLPKIPSCHGVVERRWLLMHRRVWAHMIAIERVLTKREHASERWVRRHDTAPAASLRRGCTADVPGHLRDGVGRCCRRPYYCHVATLDLGDVAAAARYPLVWRQAHVNAFPAARQTPNSYKR